MELLRQDRRIRQEEQERQNQAEGSRLDAELKDEDGRALAKHVKNMLEKRIEALLDGDPEAKAYVKMLKELGVKMAIGRSIAQRIIARELGDVTING